MPTPDQIQEAQDRIDKLFSSVSQVQRPVSVQSIPATIAELNKVKTEINTIIAILES